MAVVIETTLGDIIVDLFLDRRPVTCLNFLKLCKMKYYNFNLFHTIRSGFIAQTGDPTGEGSGGKSIWGILEGPEKRFFSAEKMPKIRHTDAGLLSMVCTDDMMVGSQFFITLASNLDSLDGVHCVIGEVTEGHEVLRKLNEVICDESHRPYRDVRITHTVVLEDPFNDPPGLRAPSRSPSPNIERLKGGRIAPDEQLDETEGKSAAEIQEMIEEKEAKARATILEIVGDLPDADIAPPENVLFVCKLNPVTTDEDLEIIFSRFGKIVSCEVIRDRKTGDSLQYAFIEFDDKKSCENAYFKMDNVLIDDRRIHVDFSQSVSKMQWLGKGRGVRHIKDDSGNDGHISKPRRSKSRERNQIDHHHKNKERDSNRQNRSRDTEKHLEHRHKSERKSKYERSQRDRVRSPIDNGRDNRQTKSDRNDRNDRLDRNDRNGRDNRQIKPHRNERNVKPTDDGRDRNHKRESDTAKEEKEKYEHRKTYSSNKHSPPRRNRKESESAIRDHKNYNSRDVSKDARENSNHKNKIKKLTKESSSNTSKRSHNELTPRTPSPVVKNKTDKNGSLNERKKRKLKIHKKKSQVKKKRAESTSSSSDSESSSETSSSESSSTSSSSSEDKKRKKSSRKRKYSSSSSSESSSSTSSSDSSTSSSSSSDSEVDRKKSKKKVKKVQIKNSKKKL